MEKSNLFEVESFPNTLIPLSDSIKLSSYLWLPKTASPSKFPTILEYLPYGYNTGTAIRDYLTHNYFASHGYACLRVDMRGSGESEGLIFDEYVEQEQKDCLEVMDWIEKQPWSDGKIGMMGISWGGFNGLQVGYLNPKQLKAIITLCSTDDRYRDDIHFKGGSLLSENIGWASCMQCFSSTIPDPIFNPNWEELWLNRLKNQAMWIEPWLKHQERDAYWKHGSICEDYGRITAPVYLIGGWNDSYKSTVLRMFQNLKSPRKALIGPWAHKYPHIAKPEPKMMFPREAVKFWDFWLKDKQNGIMEEPKVSCYILESHKPKPFHEFLKGFWVMENDLNCIKNRKLLLNNFGLSWEKNDKNPNNQVTVNSPLSCGKHCGEYCVIWMGPDWPTDQAEDDSHSLIFDTEPFPSKQPFLGTPTIHLFVSSNKTCGQIIVRLSEVHKTGEINRISYGVLNLQFREGFEKAISMEIDKIYEVKVVLDDFGYEIAAGNKLRVAISTEYFPLVFPLSEKPTITVHLEKECWLEIPVYEGKKIEENPFGEMEALKPLDVKYIKKGENKRKVTEDVADQSIKTEIVDDFGVVKYPNGIIIGERCEEEYLTKLDDTLSAKIEIKWDYLAIREEMGLKVEVKNIARFQSDKEYFYVENDILAAKNGKEIFSDQKKCKVKRI